jgi:hypothetical protein
VSTLEVPAPPKDAEQVPPTGLPHAMPLSRRSVLALAAAAGAALAVPAGVRWAVAGEPQLVASAFTPHLGRAFTFELAEGPVVLVLEAVEGLGPQPVAERRFTLRFSGPVATVQGGQVGQLRGPAPTTTLLVVPNGLARGGAQEWSATIDGGRDE